MRWSIALSLLVVAPVAVADPPSAGTQDAAEERDGFVPARLLAQADLSYPDDAPPGLHGDVVVSVAVDADGSIAGVKVLSGPEVFHEASIEAATRLAFAPATLHGVPVPTEVPVRFHFAPAPLDEDDVFEVVVHASDPDREDTRARTTLDGRDLARASGGDLATTVADVPGVTLAQGTAAVSKPIIRGHTERRLLLLVDGVRHESQKWGPDHAPEIDPFSAGSISVIRGAAGTRYGPDAIGGVILVTPPPLRMDPGIGGTARIAGGSNGRRGYAALRLDAVPAAIPGVSARVEGNVARSASHVAPDYVLGNTASAVFNLGGAVQWTRDAASLKLSWRHHDLRAGVFYGVGAATPDDFLAQLSAPAPPSADLWTVSGDIDRPYQQVRHDLIALHAVVPIGGAWHVDSHAAFQRNRRREFEATRSAITGPQFDFTLRTASVDATMAREAVPIGPHDLEGAFGIQASFQENVYDGLPLVPNHRAIAAGVFANERLSLSRVDLSAGARLDHLSRTAFLADGDYQRHLRRGTLDDTACADITTAWRCPSAWTTGAASLGGLWHVMPDVVDAKIDLSTASRFPSVDELYLSGTAPSLPVYAWGFPNLGVETTFSATGTLGVRTAAVVGELSAFASYTDGFINFAPELGPDGTPRFEVTIRGASPTWAFRPVDAVMSGADGRVSVLPEAAVGVDLSGAFVRARDAATGDFLVGTPPDRAGVDLILRPPDTSALKDIRLAGTTDLVARQSRTDPAKELAPPPSGYVLVGLTADARVSVSGQQVTVGVEAHNLLDTAYRDYTSLLRFYADQPGRNVRAWVALDF